MAANAESGIGLFLIVLFVLGAIVLIGPRLQEAVQDLDLGGQSEVGFGSGGGASNSAAQGAQGSAASGGISSGSGRAYAEEEGEEEGQVDPSLIPESIDPSRLIPGNSGWLREADLEDLVLDEHAVERHGDIALQIWNEVRAAQCTEAYDCGMMNLPEFGLTRVGIIVCRDLFPGTSQPHGFMPVRRSPVIGQFMAPTAFDANDNYIRNKVEEGGCTPVRPFGWEILAEFIRMGYARHFQFPAAGEE